jgi:DNA polymerase III subunit beta
MRITANRSNFLEAIQTAALVKTKGGPAILAYCLLTASEAGKATLRNTNQDTEISIALENVQVEKPGSVLLPTEKTLAILRELQDATIVIHADGETTMISALSTEFEVTSANVLEYPASSIPGDGSPFSMQAASLSRMLARTMFATSTGNTRFALGGVLFDFDEKANMLRLVATDGRRLSVVEEQTVPTTGEEVASSKQFPIVPEMACQVLQRLLNKDPNDTVSIRFAGLQGVQFKTTGATLYSRLLEGSYPPWESILPKQKGHSLECCPAVLHGAIKQAAIMETQEQAGIVFRFEAGNLLLRATSTKGRARINMPIPDPLLKYEFKADAAFCCEYLRCVMDETTVNLEMPKGDGPVMFSSGSFRHVIMPMGK